MPSLMRQINITARCATLYRERELEGTGLSGCHTPYLLTLYRRPGLTQEELAQDLNVNKSTVTRQLAVLEKEGYVRREPSPEDRRSMLVYPTEKAHALHPRLTEILRTWSAYLTADLTDAERETLILLMSRVSQRAEAYVKGDEPPCAPSCDT